jgi:hypothetical protein
MSFQSDAQTQGVAFGAAAGTADAFKIAKGLARSHVFCEPGDVRRVPGTDVLAYVLGPPRSDARLRQMDPSRRDPETFDRPNREPATTGVDFARPDPTFSLRSMVESHSPFNAFVLPLLGPDSPTESGDVGYEIAAAEQEVYERSFPFDRSRRVSLPVAEAAAASDGAADGPASPYPALAAYFNEINAWRRIDFDWLAGAEAFALQADSLTNNTCLVLAFELPPQPNAERNVLLFVGDAQVGNWLSWDEIERWHPIDGVAPSRAQPDVADLLRRVVFYKVGHHGSHNATLKARGVERMRADQKLTAFVPVSVPMARMIKDWCDLPLDALLDALAERTGRRVVLADGTLWPEVPPHQLARARARIGVEVSETLLPPKVRLKDGKEIEGAVPLWTQIGISF